MCSRRSLLALAAVALLVPAADAGAASYVNAAPITIPATGPATPSASVVAAAGETGVVSDVVVSLRGVTHPRPSDLEVLLVAPNGAQAHLMSDACAPLENARLVFADANPRALGNLVEPCSSIQYRPTNHAGFPDAVPAAPEGERPASYDAMRGGPPNGEWKLYVHDGVALNGGAIADGWALGLTTAEPETYVPGTGTAGAAGRYPMTREVRDAEGRIEDVDVTLEGVTHPRVEDLDVVLIGPEGQQVDLMSDLCPAAARGARWTFDDEVGEGFPTFGECPSGRYRPHQRFLDDQLPPPVVNGDAPNLFLDAFDGADPNGTWGLYVADDRDGADGAFLNGFSLDIETRPPRAVRFRDGDLEIGEGETARVRLTRFEQGRGYRRASVTLAPAGDGDLAVARTVELADDVTAVDVPITAVDDDAVEGPERVTIALDGAEGDARIAERSSIVVTVRDDDVAPPPPAAGPGAVGAPRGAGSLADRRRPVVSRVRVRGRTLSYTLSEPARVAVVVQRRIGSKVKTVVKKALPIARAGAQRVRLKRLRHGRYRVTVTATDAAGNRSRPSSRPFARRRER